MLLQIQINGMKMLGLWTFNKSDITALIHRLLIFLILMTYLTSDVISIFKCNNELDCIIDSVAFSIQIVVGSYSFLAVRNNTEIFYKTINRLEELIEEYKTHEYTKRADKHATLFVKVCHSYFVIGMTQFCVMGIFSNKDCMKKNVENTEIVCNFGAAGWFPFDITENPGYLIAYIYQMSSEGIVISCCLLPMYLYGSILYHIVAHFQFLHENLTVIQKNKTHELREKALQGCIKYQQAICELAGPFLDACNRVLFICVVFMPIMLGTLSFLILKMCVTTIDIWSMGRCTLHLVGWTTAQLAMCVLGQLIHDESLSIAMTAYNVPWYEESVAFQKMILLVILRSNKPVTLPTASVGDACFESFTQVVKTAYSFIALMYNTLVVE